MNSKRTKSALINSSILTIIQILTIFLKFIVQTIFIYFLGKTYLGINGLFVNIVSILSFADLGIDTSIIYSLYQPLAKKDKIQTSALMNFLKKAYNLIGITVGLFGLVVMIFLPIFIKDFYIYENIKYYYILYLANSVISYFFTYKRSLLIADQREYVSSINQFAFMLLQVLLQAVVLLLFRSYGMYLWIAIFSTFFSNIIISRRVDKDYPFLGMNKDKKVKKEELIKIKNNIIGMIGSRIGSIIVRSTDNLLLSTFLGLQVVGVYSNYLLIITSVSGVLTKMMSSVTATVGNLIAETNDSHTFDVFMKHFMINFYLVSITSGCLLTALNKFINFWAGANYVLPTLTVYVIVLNYFVDQLRQTYITFNSAYGLFVPNGKKSIFEAFINLLLSLMFLTIFKLGISGVLLGTMLTDIILNSWFEPMLIFFRGFKNESKKFLYFYFRVYWLNMISMVFIIFIVNLMISKLDELLSVNLMLTVIINIFLMIMSLAIYIFVIYRKHESVSYIINIAVNLFRKND